MKPEDDYRNGDDAEADGDSASSSSSSEGGAGDGLSLRDEAAPARALAALNALRKSRQHYDVVLLAGGAEVPAHRAVLAAASPRLLRALQAPGDLRVDGVDADALRAIVEFAYTGRLRARSPRAARRLYRAAWRLRVEAVRAPLADRLLRAVAPPHALPLRELPALSPAQLRALDDYIAAHFDEICECGALAELPVINIELAVERDGGAEGGRDAAAVADAALAWLRAHPDPDPERLGARAHALYVDARGELRERGEAAGAARPEPAAGGDWAVLAARPAPGGARALLALAGRLAAVRVRAAPPAAAPAAPAAAAPGERLANMRAARCALGAGVLAGRLVVCGGYDRARVLRGAEAYDAAANAWAPLADMRGARARFPAASVGGALLALGGSDGLADLASVEALDAPGAPAWRAAGRLPLARAHAAAAADDARGALYVLGGLAAGLSLRRVDKYTPAADAWEEAPPLITGRSQCASVVWQDALWALGGCDTWHCLASTERLPLSTVGAGWLGGPALPTARRSAGGAAWRGRLGVVGGSDGAASLRRSDWLAGPGAGADWRAGPELRRPRAGHALAVLHDVLYAAGGFDGKHFLACVECLRDPDGEWTTLRAAPGPAPALAPAPAPGPAPAPAPGPAPAPAPAPEPASS